MSLFQPALLGIIQGFTEFLPISSSAHLIIFPWFFHWQNFSLTFDVALHAGTLLAIIVYFWEDWKQIIVNAFVKSQIVNRKSQTKEYCHSREDGNLLLVDPRFREDDSPNSSNLTANSYPKNLLWILVAATIPGAIAGMLLESQAETIFRNPLLVAINLAVFGVIIWAIDRYSKKSYKLSAISYKLALAIGFAQMLAIVPGVSRSGSTMAAGRAIGLSRPDSARFSFLLAAPIMLGTALFSFRHLTKDMADLGFFIGILASAVFGFIAIKYLLKYLQKGNYAIFMWYRVIIAIIVVIVYVLR